MKEFVLALRWHAIPALFATFLAFIVVYLILYAPRL